MVKPGHEDIVNKGEFAKLCKVTPSCLSQWIARGKISPAALVGEGRAAQIRVRQAWADLKRNLDPGQMTGNGLRTRIPGGPLVPPPPEPPPTTEQPAPPIERVQWRADAVEVLDPASESALLKREQRRNWRMRNDERDGVLIEADEAERRWGEQIVEIRSAILGIVGELPALLPHLTPQDLAVIDRAYRDGLNRAAGGGA